MGVADRVNLGLVPSSEGGWPVACRALKPTTGGWLHVHGNVSSKRTNVEQSIIDQSERNPWEIPSVKVHEQYTHEKDNKSNTKHDQEEINCVQQEQLTFGIALGNGDEKNCLEHKLSSRNEETKTEVYSKREIWSEWARFVARTIEEMLSRENPLEAIIGKEWKVTIRQIEHVKSYAPHIDHLVVDLECRPTIVYM